ncbi:MAG: chloride channel protein [Terracidiphilus sp.]
MTRPANFHTYCGSQPDLSRENRDFQSVRCYLWIFGAVGYIDVAVFHHSADSIGAFAVVGMGAVFAGVIRAPMTSVLIIFEMTGGYGLILPLMIANMSAFALARYWRHTPVYDALLEQDGIFLHPGSKPPKLPGVKPLLPRELPADAQA